MVLPCGCGDVGRYGRDRYVVNLAAVCTKSVAKLLQMPSKAKIGHMEPEKGQFDFVVTRQPPSRDISHLAFAKYLAPNPIRAPYSYR